MFKEFADKQREKKREGFYRNHDEERPRVLDQEAANRRARNLSQLPAYMRAQAEDYQSDGRNDYEDNRKKEASSSMARFAKLEYSVPDPHEQALTDPVMKQHVFLRHPMKRVNTVVAKRPDPRRLVQQRPLALPPPIVKEVDSDKAMQEYRMRTLLADRDPDWQPAPTGPLFERKQDVFLPIGAEREIQRMNHLPIKKGHMNYLRSIKPETIPQGQMGYTMGTNPDMMRHIPRTIDRERRYRNPEYQAMIKPKVDLDYDPRNPHVLGLTDQEERFYAENPGVATDIHNEPISRQRDFDISQNPVEYTEGNQTIDVDNAARSRRLHPGEQLYEERDYAPYPETDGHMESRVGTRTREQHEQKTIIIKEGEKMFMVDMETGVKIPMRERREYAPRGNAEAPATDGWDMESRRRSRTEGLEWRNRRYQDGPEFSEIDSHAEQRREPRRMGMRDGEQRAIQDSSVDFNMHTVEHRGFKRLVGLEHRNRELSHAPKHEYEQETRPRAKHRAPISQREVTYQEGPKGQAEMEIRSSNKRFEEREYEEREYVPVTKIDIGGRQFKTLGNAPKNSTFEQRDVEYAEAPTANVSAREKRHHTMRTDTLEDRPVEYAKTPLVEVPTVGRKTSRIEGMRELNPRMSEQHKNPDMDIPRQGGFDTKEVFLKKGTPRTLNEAPKQEWDDPDLITQQRSRMKVRGITMRKRSGPLEPQSTPVIDIGVKVPTPRQRVNESRTSTPRSTPSKKHNEEIERALKFGIIPNPL